MNFEKHIEINCERLRTDKPRRVRRLWCDWQTQVLTEWTPRKVNAERKAAYQTISDSSQSYSRIGPQLQASANLLTVLNNRNGPPLANLLTALRQGDVSARDPVIDALLELMPA